MSMAQHPFRAVLCGIFLVAAVLTFAGATGYAALVGFSDGQTTVDYLIGAGLFGVAAVLTLVASELSPTHPRVVEADDARAEVL